MKHRHLLVMGSTSLVTITFLLLANTLYTQAVPPSNSFISFWSAGRWLTNGQNPYQLDFLYPIWVAILLQPISWLPFATAQIIWLTFNQLLFIASIMLALKVSRIHLSIRPLFILILGLFLFAPTVQLFLFNQLTAVLLFLITLVAWLWQQERATLAGIMMVFLLIKPHLTLLLLFVWLLTALIQGHWRPLSSFSAALLWLLTISELIAPGWLWQWIGTWPTALTHWRVSQWLWWVDLQSFDLGILFVLLTAVLAILITLITLPINHHPPYLLPLLIVIPITLLVNLRPVTTYDTALLVLPLTILNAKLYQKQPTLHRLTICLTAIVALSYILPLLANSLQIQFLHATMSWLLLTAIIISHRAQLKQAYERWYLLRQRPLAIWPQSQKQALMRLLVMGGVMSITLHLSWWQTTHKIYSLFLMGLLTIALIISLLQILSIWYLYLHANSPLTPSLPATPVTVDVYITAYHEPLPLIKRALQAAINIHYPHNTYLLDDGRDPACQALAHQLDVTYLTRTDNKDAKAGNVNHALTQTTGEFITIFDIDHAPQPNFLDHVLGHFADPKIGFVQVMLAHTNQDESFVARAAAEQTYDAFGPTFMGMHGCGAATVVGSNTTFRRQTLQDIGGYQPGLAEDLHTSVHVHAQGWHSVYVPHVLAHGLVPSDLQAYFKQQFKWARGVFEVLLEKYRPLATHFTLNQHLAYFTRMTYYYVSGPVVALNLLFLILFLTFGTAVARADFTRYLIYWLPFITALLLIRQVANKCWRPDPAAQGFHLRGMLLVYGTWPIYTAAFLAALLRIQVPFIATPKQRQGHNKWQLLLPQTITLLLLSLSISWRLWQGADLGDWAMILFASLNILMHMGVFYAMWSDNRFAQQKQPEA